MEQKIREDISIAQILLFLKEGLSLSFSKECRYFTIIPILINILLLGLGGYFLFNFLDSYINSIINTIPEFLAFIKYILVFFAVISILLGGCYIFSTLATIIASPFYGILAERVEIILTKQKPNDDGFIDVIKDTPRILKRELQKQLYFIPRVLLLLIVFFIPILNIIFPILWFMLTSWMATIQYTDYAYDNNKTPFSIMKEDLSSHKIPSFIFGVIVCLFITIPIVNILVPACAVCAGTKYYVQLKKLKGN